MREGLDEEELKVLDILEHCSIAVVLPPEYSWHSYRVLFQEQFLTRDREKLF